MISIIICSRDKAALAVVRQNIAATVGVPYELLVTDNSYGQYGICEAYNLGAKQARYELLCFMHEDVALRTPNWGALVADIFIDQAIGVLGVAGGMYVLDVPSGWWSVYEYQRMQVIHATPASMPTLNVTNPLQEELADVAAVDGLWFCSRKAVWEQHPFDESTFPAFHFYDLDYCTQVFQHLRVCVTFQVVIEHFSTGSINDTWLLAALSYQQKWRSKLPFGVAKLTAFEQKKIKQRVLAEYTERVIQSKLSFLIASKALLHLLATTQVSRENIGLIRRFIIKRLFRKNLPGLFK